MKHGSCKILNEDDWRKFIVRQEMAVKESNCP